MKPHRIRMTHNLLLNYGLYRKMEIYRPHKATQEEMTKFHSDDYIRFLRSIRPDNMGEYNKQMQVRDNWYRWELSGPSNIYVDHIPNTSNYMQCILNFRGSMSVKIVLCLTDYMNFVNSLEEVLWPQQLSLINKLLTLL